MTDIALHFETASRKSPGYIEASLNFMAADTRQGFTESAKTDFTVIQEYAAGHPDCAGVVNYVAKIEAVVGHLEVTSGISKPSFNM